MHFAIVNFANPNKYLLPSLMRTQCTDSIGPSITRVSGNAAKAITCMASSLKPSGGHKRLMTGPSFKSNSAKPATSI